ncbi:syndecan 4-B-like [Bombina bombina]|uniref:syndecan 4-B-like n=1 Tax=Bombina bombina TaxID=8345 RepID=UPI00235AB702|nr:syndecan 4-B-like [Bombina bombina]
MNRIVLLVAMLLSAVAAESIRETETMDPRGIFNSFEGSGSLPDDEDFKDPDDYTEELDSEEYDSSEDFSGSGDIDDFDTDTTLKTPTVTLGNRIPEDDGGSRIKKLNVDDKLNGNDIITFENGLKYGDLNPSNEIPMPITAKDGLFQRAEVIAVVVAGGLVGLIVAVLIIVFLYMRTCNANKNPNDPVKKPIYTKAPVCEA